MVTQWGQFLDHDITATAETHPENCCTTNRNHEDCFPIDIGENDSFYRPKSGIRNETCHDFTRSDTYCTENGENGKPRQQFNENTHFIDASNVYGHSDKEAERIRGDNPQNGKLLTDPDTVPGRYLLPILPARRALPNGTIPKVFFAGDFRAGEMPGLLSMHTLFVLEHNRLAGNSFFDLFAKHIFDVKFELLLIIGNSPIYRDILAYESSCAM